MTIAECESEGEHLQVTGMDINEASLEHPPLEVEADRVDETTVDEEGDELHAPDGGWGWAVVFGAFLAHVISGGLDRSNGIMYLQLRKTFKQTATDTAWVIAIFVWFRHLFAPLSTALCNRFSCRLVVMLGTIPCTLGVLLSGFAPNLTYMYITYGSLTGFGLSCTFIPSMIDIGNYFDRRRGLAVGLASFGGGVGAVVFPPMIETLFENFGRTNAFLLLAGIVSHFMIVGALYRPLNFHLALTSSQKKQTTDLLLKDDRQTGNYFQQSSIMNKNNVNIRFLNLQESPQRITNMAVKKPVSMWVSNTGLQTKKMFDFSLFRNVSFCCFCIQSFLYFVSFSIIYGFLPALAKDKGLSAIQGSYLISMIGAVDSICRIVIPALLDLRKTRPYRLLVYNFVILLTCVITSIIPSCNTFWQFGVLCCLYGMASGAYVPHMSLVIIDILGVAKLSSGIGFVNFINGFSQFASQAIGGALKDHFGDYGLAFYFGSTGLLLSAIVMAMANIWLYKHRTK